MLGTSSVRSSIAVWMYCCIWTKQNCLQAVLISIPMLMPHSRGVNELWEREQISPGRVPHSWNSTTSGWGSHVWLHEKTYRCIHAAVAVSWWVFSADQHNTGWCWSGTSFSNLAQCSHFRESSETLLKIQASWLPCRLDLGFFPLNLETQYLLGISEPLTPVFPARYVTVKRDSIFVPPFLSSHHFLDLFLYPFYQLELQLLSINLVPQNSV